MRIHRPVAEQVISALSQIFGANPDGKLQPADKVIERVFKLNRKLGSRDRRFVAESTYDIVRWWRLLRVSIGRDHTSPAMQDFWHVLGAWMLLSDIELPTWPEFAGIDTRLLQTVQNHRDKTSGVRAIRESIPDWLDELGQRELGDKWDETLQALNKPAPVVIRANRLKITREHLSAELSREGIETDLAPDTHDGLILRERRNVHATESFKFGYFEVQDGASQQAAPLLAPEPGDRVVDGCAGAGGKTLHLAALMKNKGKIIAMDIHQRKLEELRKRCSRAGVDIVETRLIDSNKVIKRMERTADRVLLDVPCSGLGVLRRNPDAKWKLSIDDIDRLRRLQSEILAGYSQIVKTGGRLVYATCSILPSENEGQVNTFLKSRETGWRLLESRQYWPGENGYDGFYTALLERMS